MVPQRRMIGRDEQGPITRYEAAPIAAAPIAPPSEPPTEGVLQSIWRRKWTVFGIAFVCVAGALIYISRAPKIYESFSHIHLEQNMAMNVTPGEPVFVAPTGDNYLYTQAALIQSSAILEDAAKKLNGETSASPLKTEDLYNQVAYIKQFLNVEVGRKDDIINITFDSPDRMESSRVVNAVVDAYVEFRKQQGQDSTTEVLTALRDEKRKRDAELAEQLKKNLEFKKQNPDLNLLDPSTGTNSNIVGDQMRRLMDGLMAAELAKTDAQVQYDAAVAAAADPARIEQLSANAPATAAIQSYQKEMDQLRTQLSDAKLRLAVLLKRYGSGNPAIQQDQALIDQLNSSIKDQQGQFAKDYVQASKGDLDRMTDRVELLQKEIKQKQADVYPLLGKSAEYAVMANSAQRLEKLCDTLDSRIKELETKQGVKGPVLQVLERARPELRPAKPETGRILALALAVGFTLGGGFALLRDRMDQRLRSAEEVMALLGLPVIGVIPHMRRSLTNVARGQAVHWDPMSPVAEAYRAVRTAVYFGAPQGEAKTIVVTSPTPGEGKSTLASNLAITMAQAGKRTLLLDADFRRPVQKDLFEIEDEVGITSVLAGRDTLVNAIHHTAVTGLDLLPSGPHPLNPSELLNGEPFADILEELSQRYDHIVIDCPPVMAVTDARILAAVADMTILTLRAEKSSRQAGEHACASLSGVGARMLGVVVNDVTESRGKYGYYSGYGYYQNEAGIRRRRTELATAPNGAGTRRLPSPADANHAG